MISRYDLQKLIHRPENGNAILSVFLDMSVDSNNKRTYDIFLNQRRAQYAELASDRPNHHREPLGEAFARLDGWLEERYEAVNKGVAIYIEVGGEWIEGFQFPVPVRNRTEIDTRPVIGPLAQVVAGHRRYGVVVLDRERMRMILVQLGHPVTEREITGTPYPTPHDVKAGGEANKGYQKYKAEETRHYFKNFGVELAEFDRLNRTDGLILMGTHENVVHFRDLLPQALAAKVEHTGNARYGETWADLLDRLAPFFLEQDREKHDGVVATLEDRVNQRHFAIAGFPDTLEQLQEGKVETLLLARDLEKEGAHCLQCGFYLAREGASCPYCGGRLERQVDLVEAVIRLAEEKDVTMAFVDPESITHLNGIGALLRF